MKNLLESLVRHDRGNVHVLYALALAVLAALAQPSVTLALLYRLEDLFRLFVGQLLSLI